MYGDLNITSTYSSAFSKKRVGKDRSLAIIGETSSMVQYLGRISYCVAMLDPDPVTRLMLASLMTGSNIVCAGLELASSAAGAI
jgi:hypothetical protein